MWRERAIEKILEMGYTPLKEEDLPVDKRGKWKSLTERGAAWSETEWNRQKHQVVQFIKNDEKERPERQRKERRAARDTKLRELLGPFQHTMNVLPSNRGELSMTEIASTVASWLPLPRLSDMIELPIIQSLLEVDVPTTEMVVRFEQSRNVITTQILEFGAQVKKEWAKIVRDGRAKDESAIPLSTPCLLAIGSELNPFDKLNEDTCLLFRADTLLDFEPDQRTRSKTQSYDSLVGLVHPGQPIHTPRNNSKFATKDYNWNSKASSMARMLLSSMGHPINTASIEFSAANGRWFACGRCAGPRMHWAGLVSHYCKEADIWEDAQEHISELPDGISYRNIHAMEFDARPLVKCLSAAEAEELEARYPGGEEAIWDEELCMDANIGSPMSFHREDIYPHVVDVHGVSDPENNVDDELSIEENPYGSRRSWDDTYQLLWLYVNKLFGSTSSEIALLDTHLVQPPRREPGSLVSGSGGSSSRRLPRLASSTPSTSQLALDDNLSDYMEVESHQPSLDPLPDSVFFPLRPTVASVEPSDSDMTTFEVNPHQRPILHVYTAKTAGTQLPEVHQRELLLTSRNSKFVREDRPLTAIRDYSNSLRPPNPNSWIYDDPLLTSWEPLNPPETALDPLSIGSRYRNPYENSVSLYELDAPGDLQPYYIEEGDAMDGHNPGSDGEHEYEDDSDNRLEEDNNNQDEDIKQEINEPQPDVEEGPEDGPEDPEDGVEAILESHPVLQNIYIRTWIDSVFGGVTREQTKRTLLSYKLALEALPLDADLSEALESMAQTFRSLERKLGVSIDEHLKIYALCGGCGTRYTMDQINEAPEPGCPYISPGTDEPCLYQLWEDKKLYGGARKRIPLGSYPYFSVKVALEQMLSRPGMRKLVSGHRWNDEDDSPYTKQDWFDSTPQDRRFRDISEAWGWNSEPVMLERQRNDQRRCYEDIPGDGRVRALASKLLGLSLALNNDGFQTFGWHGYTSSGVFISINNLPYHLRNIVENILLVMIMPVPSEPTPYEFNQMMNPLIDELIGLERGLEISVFSVQTNRREQEYVHAHLSLARLDHMARIQVCGHAGTR
ncbi:Transposase family tnp2 [Ceratobasidium sp. AG-Ba]|nr:Transposase family tnp2 [Ceratobasidium sp. AG-Ba]